MASLKLMLNTSRMLNDGTYPLVFQIIHNRVKKLMYTGFHLRSEEFDPDTGQVRTHRGMNVRINRKVRKMRKQLWARIRKLELTDEAYDICDILGVLDNKSSKPVYLLEFVDAQIQRKRSLGREGIGAAYFSTRQSLSKYLRGGDVRISRIDAHFVGGYADYLKQSGVSDNTVNFYIRNFQTFYNSAVKNGFDPAVAYPFAHISARPCKTVKRALSRADMSRLLHLPLAEGSGLRFARDIFLFSFYAQGMSFVDIVFLKWRHVQAEVISYSRHKSGRLIHIGITPQIQAMLERYGSERDEAGNSYVFPIISACSVQEGTSSEYRQYRQALGRINSSLKRLKRLLDIDIALTTYVARHTWATLARDNGVPISTISESLGHTTEEMTHVYLKELDIKYLKRINKMMNDLL